MSKTRANREGNIRQRADGRWEVRITLGIDFATGEPKRISRYAATQAEAVKLLHQLSFMRDTAPNRFHTITLGEWLDMCLDVYMKNTLKQSTYNSYESYIRVHLKPALGSLALVGMLSQGHSRITTIRYWSLAGCGISHFTHCAIHSHHALWNKEWTPKRYLLYWGIIRSRLPLIPMHTFLLTTSERGWL